MGVTGLWTVVQPCARPIKIETLNKKRLAVDASIWIYQFLKAVRDKEGNALRNSHVVGFFRRICKLLFIGIKPVFVFDGGAPALKRQTISGRKQRREGRREDAVRTAGKLLALQMQRRAEEEEQNRRAAASGRTNADTEEAIPEGVVYAAELQMTPKERQQNRKFRKKDQYHLPELDMSMAEMGGPNDPRVMSLEELEEYARQFNAGEDINVYDFSKIDFNSAFFLSLPPSDRYNILNAARLRSRLRLGYSKDQLDAMFPDRMAFSKFQIERVAERNELTQRLMHVNGMGDNGAWDADGTGRVSGEKGREYVLVKNESAEGGWALGVIGDKTEGERNKPIDIDKIAEDQALDEEDEAMSEDEGGFEDVPVEGLNRIPKSMLRQKSPPRARSSRRPFTGNILQKRKALYKSRLGQTEVSPGPQVGDTADETDEAEDGTDQLFHTERRDSSASEDEGNEDDELRKAIAMSLEQVDVIPVQQESDLDDDYGEVFGDGKAQHISQPQPTIGTQLGGDNAENNGQAGQLHDTDSSGDDDFDFGKALARSKHSTKKSEVSPANRADQQKGPLPFQTLDLGSSILGKASKGKDKNQNEEEGGFVKEADTEEKAPQPLPPWFSKSDDIRPTARAASKPSSRNADDYAIDRLHDGSKPGRIRRQQTREVIDLDDIDDKQPETIDVDADDANVEMAASQQDSTNGDYETAMGDLAERMQAEPPRAQPAIVEPAREGDERDSEEPLEWEQSDHDDTATPSGEGEEVSAEVESGSEPEFEDVDIPAAASRADDASKTDDRSSVGNADEPKANVVEDDEEQPIVTVEAQTSTGFDEFEFPSDAEEDEMMRRLAAEAEEHARFASTLNKKSYTRNIEEYESELKALRTQQKKDRRDADEVTQIMVEECQQLLALFGIPFITAPMEAEAQCAELVTLGLVDGIVTDDSDIFLFGGTRIYKNMFNQAKYVECYLASDLERDFDLTRTRLIRLAHLLGSDYTEGIPGVGPVTALEIVAEFPDGLDDFRDWWSAVQTGRVPANEDASSAFRKKFRKNAAKVFTPPNFPDKRVDLAYLQPEVDADPSEFKWGVPDLDRLRSFLMATIGWSQERTDEVLVPVVRDMNRREHEGTQANITSFMGAGASVGAGAFAPRVREGKSKRMETALGRMAARAREKKKRKHGDSDQRDLNDDFVAPEDAVIAVAGSGVNEQVAQRRLPTREDGPMRLADLAAEEEEGEQSDADKSSKKAAKKSASRPKKKKQRAGL